MVVAGIDMGSLTTKVVILEGERILAAVTLKMNESSETDAHLAMDAALQKALLRQEDIFNVISTGVGRKSIPFAQTQRSIVSCLAKGAYFLFPQARMVIDVGAESTTAIRLADDGTVEDSMSNDKCAAGAGLFLDTMSWTLRIPIEELGAESLKATKIETLTSRCAVFAESEVVSLIHKDPPVLVPDILAGIHKSIVDRLFGLVHMVGVQSNVVMTGGVSKNIGIIKAMESRLGKQVFVPEDPQIIGALGAALIAQQG